MRQTTIHFCLWTKYVVRWTTTSCRLDAPPTKRWVIVQTLASDAITTTRNMRQFALWLVALLVLVSFVHGQQCLPGMWSETGLEPCGQCLPGSFSGPGSTQCTSCPSNSYQSNYGMPTCDPCLYALHVEGATHCNCGLTPNAEVCNIGLSLDNGIDECRWDGAQCVQSTPTYEQGGVVFGFYNRQANFPVILSSGAGDLFLDCIKGGLLTRVLFYQPLPTGPIQMPTQGVVQVFKLARDSQPDSTGSNEERAIWFASQVNLQFIQYELLNGWNSIDFQVRVHLDAGSRYMIRCISGSPYSVRNSISAPPYMNVFDSSESLHMLGYHVKIRGIEDPPTNDDSIDASLGGSVYQMDNNKYFLDVAFTPDFIAERCSDVIFNTVCEQAFDANGEQCTWLYHPYNECAPPLCENYQLDVCNSLPGGRCLALANQCVNSSACATSPSEARCNLKRDVAFPSTTAYCEWSQTQCGSQCRFEGATGCRARSDCLYSDENAYCYRKVETCGQQTTELKCNQSARYTGPGGGRCQWTAGACIASAPQMVGHLLYPDAIVVAQLKTVSASYGQLRGMAFSVRAGGTISRIWFYRPPGAPPVGGPMLVLLLRMPTKTFVAPPHDVTNCVVLERIYHTLVPTDLGWFAVDLPTPRDVYIDQGYVIQYTTTYGADDGMYVEQSYANDQPKPSTNQVFLTVLGGTRDGGIGFNNAVGPTTVNHLIDVTFTPFATGSTIMPNVTAPSYVPRDVSAGVLFPSYFDNGTYVVRRTTGKGSLAFTMRTAGTMSRLWFYSASGADDTFIDTTVRHLHSSQLSQSVGVRTTVLLQTRSDVKPTAQQGWYSINLATPINLVAGDSYSIHFQMLTFGAVIAQSFDVHPRPNQTHVTVLGAVQLGFPTADDVTGPDDDNFMIDFDFMPTPIDQSQHVVRNVSAGLLYPRYLDVGNFTTRTLIGASTGLLFTLRVPGAIGRLWFYRPASLLLADRAMMTIYLMMLPQPTYTRSDGVLRWIQLEKIDVQQPSTAGWFSVDLQTPRDVFTESVYAIGFHVHGRTTVVEQPFAAYPRVSTNQHIADVLGGFTTNVPSDPNVIYGPWDVNSMIDFELTLKTTQESTEWQPPAPYTPSNTTIQTRVFLILHTGGGTPAQLEAEIDKLTSRTPPDGAKVTAWTTNQVNVTMDAEAAAILAEWLRLYELGQIHLAPSDGYVFMPGVSVVAPIDQDVPPPVTIPSVNDQDEYSCEQSCFSLALEATFQPRCVHGVCTCMTTGAPAVCVPDSLSVFVSPEAMVCVPGPPEVCHSRQSTPDRLVYQNSSLQSPIFDETSGVAIIVGTHLANSSEPDECTRRDPRFFNLFPRRRFCQSRDHAYPLAPTHILGVMPRNSSTTAFMLGVNVSLADALAVAYAGEIKAMYGYVSDIVAGSSASKVYARIEYRYALSTDASSPFVQLSRLTYIDEIEPAKDRYYVNNTIAYLNCDALGWRGKETYAYLDADGKGVCDCWAGHQRNPTTGFCQPGCTDGKFGRECELTAALTSCQYRWNNATAFMRAADCVPVCIRGYAPKDGECRELPTDWDQVAQYASSSSDDVQTIVALAVSIPLVAIAIALFIYWHYYRRRRHAIKPTASRASARRRV